MRKPKVSIIIVYYKGKKDLLRCLESIKKNVKRIKYEVIIVDNSKSKKINKEVERVIKNIIYIKSPRNLGYGAGNNLGTKKARGEYLFILNPDTKVKPNSLDVLVKFLDEKKEAALVSPNIVNEKGQVYPLQGSKILTPLRGIFALSFISKIIPNNFISSNYWMKNISRDKLREVDVVPGTAFLVRKEIFKQIGGFDENMFMYFEENDLGKRIRDAGLPAGRQAYKIFIIPQAEVVHYWHSVKKPSKKLSKVFQKSRFLLFQKTLRLTPSFNCRILRQNLQVECIFNINFATRIAYWIGHN